jgi:hypothetical protein
MSSTQQDNPLLQQIINQTSQVTQNNAQSAEVIELWYTGVVQTVERTFTIPLGSFSGCFVTSDVMAKNSVDSLWLVYASNRKVLNDGTGLDTNIFGFQLSVVGQNLFVDIVPMGPWNEFYVRLQKICSFPPRVSITKL